MSVILVQITEHFVSKHGEDISYSISVFKNLLETNICKTKHSLDFHTKYL